MRERIRVFVVAAVRLYEHGLAQAVAGDDRFVVAGTAADGRTASDRVTALEPRPHVVIIDVGLAEGVAAARALRRSAPEVAVVALAVREVDVDIVAWAEAGAAALVPSDASLDVLLDVIAGAARGESVTSPRIAATLLRRVAALAEEGRVAGGVPSLTSREREIARLIDRGLSNKQIATWLQIELSTVKNHVHSILEKLGVSRRGEAVAVLRSKGALD